MQKYLPTNDLLFKKCFTSEDSLHILKAFVKDLLGIEFKQLKPKETYHIDSYKKSFDELDITRTEVDILAIGEDGSHTTIECQIQPHMYFRERTIFYLAEAFCSPFGNLETANFIKGNKFSALRPAYGINIIDFHLFDKKQPALQRFRLLNEESSVPFLGTTGKELLIACFLSLKNETIEQQSAAYHWQYFFKSGTVHADAPDYIKEAKQKIDYYKLGREEKEMIMKIDKSKAINDAVISSVRLESERMGREREKYLIARNLIEMKMPLEQVVEATGLELDTVKQLQTQHGD